MRTLGIDYGRVKIGLSIAETTLAEPFRVLRVDSSSEAIEKIRDVVAEEGIEGIVVGISEGEMGEETKKFIEDLKQKTSTPVETFDETLSTYEAQKSSIMSGIKRSKRREMEDAYAATIILQNYLDRV